MVASKHPVTALIVEDEAELRAELIETLSTLWPELEIVAQAKDGFEALRLAALHQPTFIFLDIQIPGPSGLDVARQLGTQFPIVFITAYDSYAIPAFEHGAVDYILKPLQAERLMVTIQRLQRYAFPKTPASPLRDRSPAHHEPKRYLKWLTATSGQSFRLIMTDEVVFFQSDGRYTRVVLPSAEVLISKTLKELTHELDPEQFWQIHRSTIVNAAEIVGIEPDMAGRLHARLKNRREQLSVSDTFMRKFREM